MILSLAVAAALAISVGCKTQPSHPNQLNSFDGGAYDALTVSHGALVSLRASLAGKYPQYYTVFNQAAASYATAFNAYALYRTAATSPNQAQVMEAVENLTVSIVALEDAFETDMHVNASDAEAIRLKAAVIRKSLGPNVSVADVLTALEIAAAIAETVPATQPYSTIAAIVIAATNGALDAENAAAGQLIDLSTIQPIAALQ